MTKQQLPEKIEYAAALAVVKDLIHSSLLDSDALVSEMMHHLTLSEGKNFRALLLMAAASDDSGNVPKNALVAAAAMEMLHLASLVHDDVIDNADTRRGLPSVRESFGNKSAVIAGDYLFCKCFLLTAELSEHFQSRFLDIAKTMSKLCLGEMREMQHHGDTALSIRQYFRIIAGKTSALFALALYSGALIGGADEKEARRLARFGHYIGMAFQLTDDCLDYQSDDQTMKKPVRHDLNDGVVTLPLIFALMQKPSLQAALKAPLDTRGALAVAAEVIALGGVDRTMAVAGKYCDKAEKILDGVLEPKRDLLLSLLEKIKARVY
ncbi:polyprenyl synthetase family protein [Oscillospiraceae bacterium CM]|nr:polyprenyl synthetase family protein [Oscillospiraceae bacterium CM]